MFHVFSGRRARLAADALSGRNCPISRPPGFAIKYAPALAIYSTDSTKERIGQPDNELAPEVCA